MNDMVKSHNSHKSILAMIASILACFALVLALVPVQSFAVDGDGTGDAEAGSTTTPGDDNQGGDEGDDQSGTTTPGGNEGDDQPGGNEGDDQPGTTPGDDDGKDDQPGTTTPGDDESDTTAIAIPTATQNLTFTGKAQQVLKLDKSYVVKPALEEGQTVEETETAIMATNAGTYSFSVTPAKGYEWRGGGNKTVTVEATVAEANLSKATTMTVANATFMGEPVEPKVTITMADGTELKKDVDFELLYSDNDEVGTGFVVATGIGNFTGIKVDTFEVVASQAMFRVYNPNSGEHFYTADENERNELVALGWKNENIGWYAPATSSAPVFRLYNPNAGEHHFTLDSAEHDALIKEGWNDEGIGWYSDENETVEVLRQYNPNAFANNHNYTTSVTEYEHNNDLGWQPEGVAWYAAADGK